MWSPRTTVAGRVFILLRAIDEGKKKRRAVWRFIPGLSGRRVQKEKSAAECDTGSAFLFVDSLTSRPVNCLSFRAGPGAAVDIAAPVPATESRDDADGVWCPRDHPR